MPRPVRRYRRPGPREPDAAETLAHIASLSQNARTTWFGLLGLLAFVGVTLLGHEDADFFAKGAATQLPLVGITVPVEAFFLTAPVLVAAVYAYLHLYLMSLWDALAEAPARIDGQPLSDRVYPWLISHAALWYRKQRRDDDCTAPRALGRVVVGVSIFLGWALGIIVLGGLWVRSMPVHNPWLTGWIGFWLLSALFVGLTGYLTMRARMRGVSQEETAQPRRDRHIWGATLTVAVAYISLEATGPLHTIPTPAWLSENYGQSLPSRANLVEAELTPRTKDWQPFERWLQDLRREREMGDPEQDPLIPTEDEIARWRDRIAALDAPSMSGRDLREASARAAFLPGADLGGARMADSECTRAAFLAALVHSADLTCKPGTLEQSQLEFTVGDEKTMLPDGLTVWSCLDEKGLGLEDRERIEAAITHHPETSDDPFRPSRAEFRKALFCGEDKKAHHTGSWAFEKRFLDD